MSEAAESLRPVARLRGVPVVLARQGCRPVWADPDKVQQILTNLISNALKFSPAGEAVTVGVRPDPDRLVRFEVRDRGPGIPVERLGDAIARGVRLDSNGAGTGLGLAIVADVVEAWGGALELRDGSPGLAVSVRFGGRAVPSQPAL